jgi:MFS family permease
LATPLNSVDDGHPAGWYLASVATFMIPAGIQTVLLPYLLVIELSQPAARFGVFQMIGQLPILLFLLFGGLLADRVDPRRLLMGLHAAAMVMPLLLAAMLWRQQLSESLVLLYALAWGLVTAFVMPARDGLLRRVAGDQVQRMVMLVTGTQFGVQMVGQALGGRAAHWGAISILLAQCLLLAVGVHASSKLPPAPARAAMPEQGGPGRQSLWREFGAGLSLIFADAPMRAVFLLTLGMGIFFGGVLAVLIPLAIRDLYAGSAQDIATGFVMVGIGMLISIAALMRSGGLGHPARAVVIASLLGCCVLAPLALAPPKWLFYLCIFCWGLGGGVTMSMSRTILQERAPATHQSRVMAAQSLAMVGGGPIGSLLMGLAVGAFGVRWAVLVPILGVATTSLGVLASHSIWWLRSRSHAA